MVKSIGKVPGINMKIFYVITGCMGIYNDRKSFSRSGDIGSLGGRGIHWDSTVSSQSCVSVCSRMWKRVDSAFLSRVCEMQQLENLTPLLLDLGNDHN